MKAHSCYGKKNSKAGACPGRVCCEGGGMATKKWAPLGVGVSGFGKATPLWETVTSATAAIGWQGQGAQSRQLTLTNQPASGPTQFLPCPATSGAGPRKLQRVSWGFDPFAGWPVTAKIRFRLGRSLPYYRSPLSSKISFFFNMVVLLKGEFQ